MGSSLVAVFTKRFAELSIDADFHFLTDALQIVVLFGPSGCGKSTILRCLAGLLHPDEGEIRFAGEQWFSSQSGVRLRPQQRGVGFLFQQPALFPHLTVRQNIAFGLGHLAAVEQRQRVETMLQRFHLAGLEDRLPRQLSGGEQQRVALARSIVVQPRLLLLDEPFSALDQPLRETLRREVRSLLEAARLPVLWVTHDRIEAMTLADQLIVLDHGRILQIGSAEQVFTRPASLAVARLVGTETVGIGKVSQVQDGLATVAIGSVALMALADASLVGQAVYVCIRGEEVTLVPDAAALASARNRLSAIVRRWQWEGPMVRVELDVGFPLTALVTRPAREELQLEPGKRVTALIKAPAIHLIPCPRKPDAAPHA